MSLGVAASSCAWLLQSGFRQVRKIADRNDDGLALEMALAERIPLRLNAPGRYPSTAKAARMASRSSWLPGTARSGAVSGARIAYR
jgi:hypothetical protein